MSLRRLSLSGLILLATLAGWIACVGLAQAAYGPFALVAGSPSLRLQADYAYDAAISANGEYVAYTGSIASQPGVYRQDLATGEVQVVALGADTGVPSISEDGRYVSFTTNDDPLTGEPAGECSSVYVRDMSKHVAVSAGKSSEEAGAYTLVSAESGSTESLTYAKPTTKGQPCGSAAAYRVAISGSGQEVAFTVLSGSDLTGSQTPPNQVAVRYLKTKQTELVSATRTSLEGTGEPQPVPGGGALAGPSTTAPKLLSGVPTSASTAAISADGSTVAWMGIGVQEQTDLDTPLPTPPKGAYADEYAEPLWRRIEGGSRAPTRSVLAGGNASAPECPPSCTGGLNLLWNQGEETTLSLGPILGSFLSSQGFAATGTNTDPLDVVTPQLSANGLTVALLSTQPTYGEEPVYPNNDGPPPTANAFVVNMTPGLSRAQAITRLTAWASLDLRELALAGPIEEIAISPDGTQVAFITTRVEFPLAPPALVTPPLSQANHGQVYVANLPAGTLEFISQGYEGQPANGGALDVSLDEDGGKIALASAASNLAFGTDDEGTSSVFVTEAIGSPAGSGQQSVSPLPGNPDPSPQWSISATASYGAKGSLLLYVSVPGAGSLTASASAAVPTTVAESSGKGRERRGSSRKRERGHSASRRGSRATVAIRQIAQAKETAKAAGVLELHLTPASRYRSLLTSSGGLYANIRITFTATGHPALSQELGGTFQANAKQQYAKGASNKKRSPHPSAKKNGERR